MEEAAAGHGIDSQQDLDEGGVVIVAEGVGGMQELFPQRGMKVIPADIQRIPHEAERARGTSVEDRHSAGGSGGPDGCCPQEEAFFLNLSRGARLS